MNEAGLQDYEEQMLLRIMNMDIRPRWNNDWDLRLLLNTDHHCGRRTKVR